MLRRVAPTLVVALVSLASAAARADVVEPPPTGCPIGTLGQTCHGEPHCAPQLCGAEDSCPSGQECVRRSFCVREVFCSGGWGGGGDDVTDARGSCSPSASCPPDRTCSELAVCVPAAPGEDASAGIDAGGGREHTSYGCGCRAAGRARARLTIAAIGLALLVVMRRRWRSA